MKTYIYEYTEGKLWAEQVLLTFAFQHALHQQHVGSVWSRNGFGGNSGVLKYVRKGCLSCFVKYISCDVHRDHCGVDELMCSCNANIP